MKINIKDIPESGLEVEFEESARFFPALRELEASGEYEFPERVRLRSSAPICHLSYAATIEDREQLPTALLVDVAESEAPADPGWHAGSLLDRVSSGPVTDPVPPVRDDEVISGGASTINRHRN